MKIFSLINNGGLAELHVSTCKKKNKNLQLCVIKKNLQLCVIIKNLQLCKDTNPVQCLSMPTEELNTCLFYLNNRSSVACSPVTARKCTVKISFCLNQYNYQHRPHLFTAVVIDTLKKDSRWEFNNQSIEWEILNIVHKV